MLVDPRKGRRWSSPPLEHAETWKRIEQSRRMSNSASPPTEPGVDPGIGFWKHHACRVVDVVAFQRMRTVSAAYEVCSRLIIGAACPVPRGEARLGTVPPPHRRPTNRWA
jgi:hypothetical protein